MDKLKQIQNTFKSFKGRIKALENDPNLDLQGYFDRTSALEHEFYDCVGRILERDEDVKQNVSSIELARQYGLFNNDKG